jgi:hypothetical protein
VSETKQIIVRIGGAMARMAARGIDDERNLMIDRAMAKLFDDGCRRFRTVRLPRNGDYDRYRVMGW